MGDRSSLIQVAKCLTCLHRIGTGRTASKPGLAGQEKTQTYTHTPKHISRWRVHTAEITTLELQTEDLNLTRIITSK